MHSELFSMHCYAVAKVFRAFQCYVVTRVLYIADGWSLGYSVTRVLYIADRWSLGYSI